MVGGSTGAAEAGLTAALPEGAPSPRLGAVAGRIVSCRRCPRLVAYLATAHRRFPGFWCRPVPGFGDPNARLVIVGLAPGLRGANRTGRMFTGDASGAWLFRVLAETGFSPRARSEAAGDGLALADCYITAAARCAPPANKPNREELDACRPFLTEELGLLPRRRLLLALGRIGHDAVLKTMNLPLARYAFAHGARHALPDGRVLLDCYHCSRQNTNTGRLTWSMFLEVFRGARALVS
ncbi:MAG: uracil-DNA glycosylase [Planctomycetes bacterium]|nr:uracil-DNA glycosylase [Planctomycetota bacterium]